MIRIGAPHRERLPVFLFREGENHIVLITTEISP